MSNVNIVQKQVGTLPSDGINIFCVVFMASVQELNGHTVYKIIYSIFFLWNGTVL
jgi:hypothetical protein